MLLKHVLIVSTDIIYTNVFIITWWLQFKDLFKFDQSKFTCIS